MAGLVTPPRSFGDEALEDGQPKPSRRGLRVAWRLAARVAPASSRMKANISGRRVAWWADVKRHASRALGRGLAGRMLAGRSLRRVGLTCSLISENGMLISFEQDCVACGEQAGSSIQFGWRARGCTGERR